MTRVFIFAAFLALSAPAFSQGFEFGVGPGGFRFGDDDHEHWEHRHRHYGHADPRMCAELRAACMHKEELGEVGQGNCERYRSMCR